MILYGRQRRMQFANRRMRHISKRSTVCGMVGAPATWFFTRTLQRSADIFTIELLDMKSCHRVVRRECAGGNFRAAWFHAIQVERELRADWLRLREAILAAPKKPKAYLELMAASFSSFAALFRHALLALGEAPRRRNARPSTGSLNLAPIEPDFKRFSASAKEK